MIYIPRYYVYMELDFASRYMEIEEYNYGKTCI